MKNYKIIEIAEDWISNKAENNDVMFLINSTIELLNTKNDLEIDDILSKLSVEAYQKYYNLINLCLSHQALYDKNNEFLCAQYQFLLPVHTFPLTNEVSSKVLTKIPTMAASTFGDGIGKTLDIEGCEIYIYPNLIPKDNIDYKFSKLFHLYDEINLIGDCASIYVDDKPHTSFIFGRILSPSSEELLTNEIEQKLQNPINNRKLCLSIQNQLDAYARMKKMPIKHIVGNHNTLANSIINSNSSSFIAEVVSSLYQVYDSDEFKDLVGEISFFDDIVYILIYEQNKCSIAYFCEERYFNDITGQCEPFDIAFYSKILEETGLKRVLLSNRDFGKDFDKIIGLDIRYGKI